MSQKPVSRSLLLWLTGGLVVLSIAITVLWAVSTLLSGMGDPNGATAVKYVALAAGILWVIDLVGLVLLQAVGSLADIDEPPEQ
jgi:hypothetical protein